MYYSCCTSKFTKYFSKYIILLKRRLIIYYKKRHRLTLSLVILPS
nr:MAG TPA: hypothetical protein [Caudoviricetes sp.]